MSFWLPTVVLAFGVITSDVSLAILGAAFLIYAKLSAIEEDGVL